MSFAGYQGNAVLELMRRGVLGHSTQLIPIAKGTLGQVGVVRRVPKQNKRRRRRRRRK